LRNLFFIDHLNHSGSRQAIDLKGLKRYLYFAPNPIKRYFVTKTILKIKGHCKTERPARSKDLVYCPEGSIKNQEQRLMDYVKFRNADGSCFGEIIEVFSDPGISAKDMKRPALQKLLHKIRAKEIDLVLVMDLSRFTRSTKDFSILWDFMSSHGCKFQSLRENFDSTTAAGEMIMFTLANFAQFERRQTAERISASFLARAKRGLYNGGSVPLGFRIDPETPGRLEVICDEAEIVRLCFKTFLDIWKKDMHCNTMRNNFYLIRCKAMSQEAFLRPARWCDDCELLALGKGGNIISRRKKIG